MQPSLIHYIYTRTTILLLRSSSCTAMASSSRSTENQRRMLISFSYENLKKATNDFHPFYNIGAGAQGSVYKALAGAAAGLPSLRGKMVAIKCPNNRHNSREAIHSEFKIMEKLSHPNIVRLWGTARRGADIYLVYEFMEKGTLYAKLAGSSPLSWEQRKGIIMDVAEGIMYLHERQCPIIHGDIKSTNILLDMNLKAKIGDFGTARELDGPQPQHSTDMGGTPAYMDMERLYGTICPATDVYSFAVVVLEILTGKSACFEDKNDRTFTNHLIEWVEQRQNTIAEIMDEKLRGRYVPEEAKRIVNLACDCGSRNAVSRPTMKGFLAAIRSEAAD